MLWEGTLEPQGKREKGEELWGAVLGGPQLARPFPHPHQHPLHPRTAPCSFSALEKQFPVPETSPDIYIEAATRNFLENSSFSAHSHFKGRSQTPKAGGLCGSFKVASGKRVWWERSTEEASAPGPLRIPDQPWRRGEASASVSRKRVDQALAGGFTFVPYSCPQLSAPVTGLKFGFLLPVGV